VRVHATLSKFIYISILFELHLTKRHEEKLFGVCEYHLPWVIKDWHSLEGTLNNDWVSFTPGNTQWGKWMNAGRTECSLC
jgi:hypothetical protein